ncbi:MAG: hypothetical protein CK532_04140 [Flavobacteriales bacterium]|nr:MAG: hypothetical protein CK532_04140 [Flavobacteriales bacterium]
MECPYRLAQVVLFFFLGMSNNVLLALSDTVLLADRFSGCPHFAETPKIPAVVFLGSMYSPPVVSLDRKSLRIINMHGAAVLPKGKWEIFIQHRFGTFQTGPYNWYGFDQSYMRLGFDYGLSDATSMGISRSSMQKTADVYFKYQFIGKTIKRVNPIAQLAPSVNLSDSAKETKTDDEGIENRRNKSLSAQSPTQVWMASWYSNLSVNCGSANAIAPEPFYFSNRLRFVNTLIVSANIKNRFLVAITPSLVHINLVDSQIQANDIGIIGGYARIKISDKYALTAEIQKPVADHFIQFRDGYSKSVSIPASAYLGLGFEIFSGKHMFQLSLSNAQSMNESTFMVQNNPSFTVKNLRFGFNIVRRW